MMAEERRITIELSDSETVFISEYRNGLLVLAIRVPLADLLKFAFNLPISVFESMPADLMGDGRVDLSFASAIRAKLEGE